MKRRPPFVTNYRDRHRKMRWRFRRRGYPETQTTADYGSAEWMAWYLAAMAGERVPVGVSRSAPGTINALATAYYQSADWKTLRPATQTGYRGEIERLRSEYGERSAVDIQAKHIRNMLDKMADRPNAANNRLRVLRVLLKFAKNREWRTDNPALEVGKLRIPNKDGYHTWTETEIAGFEAKWPVGTRERLAFDLLLYTGQRSGDVRLMARGQLQDGFVSVRQSKTNEPLEIRIHEALEASLNAAPAPHLLLITTYAGEAYTAKGFGNWFSGAARAAGLVNCSAHGLRKSAAVRMAEAGCTASQIMAVTGHRSLKEVDRYTRKADQRANAKEAISKVEKTQRERNRV
jgi:integrase